MSKVDFLSGAFSRLLLHESKGEDAVIKTGKSLIEENKSNLDRISELRNLFLERRDFWTEHDDVDYGNTYDVLQKEALNVLGGRFMILSGKVND